MDNIIYVTSTNDSDYTIIGRDSTGDINGSDPILNFNVGDVIYFYVYANSLGTPDYFHLKTQPSTGTDDQISIPSGTYKGISYGNLIQLEPFTISQEIIVIREDKL